MTAAKFRTLGAIGDRLDGLQSLQRLRMARAYFQHGLQLFLGFL